MPPKKKMKPTGTLEALLELLAAAGASVERPPSTLPGSSNASAGGALGLCEQHYGVDVAPLRSNEDRHGVAI